MTRIGTIGGAATATVDAAGCVTAKTCTLDWWIGADDRWHEPALAAGRRQARIGPGPVVETSIRVPGGEAHHRVYAVAAPDAIVVEVENASPAPFVFTAVLRAKGTVALHDRILTLDAAPVLVVPRPPLRWSAVGEGSTKDVVFGGGAAQGPFVAVTGEAAEVALCFSVSHRTRTRVALASDPVDLVALPSPDETARGWEQQLDRGMRTELPSPLQDDVDAARADLLLAAPSAAAFVALEAWGFDKEAEGVWSHLGWRERRRAARRAVAPSLLTDVHAQVVREQRDGRVDVLPGFRTEWLGQHLAVHDIPLREGLLSYAVRWHGARPALLWDAPAGVTLRAPALDPAWSSTTAVGEGLLAEPRVELLAMGRAAAHDGTPIDEPDSFT